MYIFDNMFESSVGLYRTSLAKYYKYHSHIYLAQVLTAVINPLLFAHAIYKLHEQLSAS